MVSVAWGMFLAFCLYQVYQQSATLAVLVVIGGLIGAFVGFVRYTVKHGGGHGDN